MLKTDHSFLFAFLASVRNQSLKDPQTDNERSPGFINGWHVYTIQEQKSLGKGTLEHTPVPRSKWALLPPAPKAKSWDGHAHLWEENYVTRTSEQTRSPWTPSAMWTRMASPWLCDMQWPRLQARCSPVNIKFWQIVLPTIEASWKPLCGQGSSVGLPSPGLGCEVLPWHLTQRRRWVPWRQSLRQRVRYTWCIKGMLLQGT